MKKPYLLLLPVLVLVGLIVFVTTNLFTKTPAATQLAAVGASDTDNAPGWTPPIGIPEPSFGLHEVAPAQPAAWPSAAVPGDYYIDNTNANATDTDNVYGYPDKPRKTLPRYVYLIAGGLMEIRGNPAPPNPDDPNTTTMILPSPTNPPTAVAPAFIQGGISPSSPNQGVISGTMMKMQNGIAYVVVENLVFDGLTTTATSTNFQIINDSHHIAVRNSEFKNTHDSGVIVQPGPGQSVHDVLVYNNHIHDTGDWTGSADEDHHGVAVGTYGRTLAGEVSSTSCYNVWILDNEFSHISGDSVQVNSGQGHHEDTHHVYIGRNVSSWNRQSGYWVKQATDVIISQNKASEMWSYGLAGVGQFGGYQYCPDRVWFLYNEGWNANFGIRQSDTSSPWDIDPNHRVFIIGNYFHDIHPQNEAAYSPTEPTRTGVGISFWWGNEKRYVVNNTISNAWGGINVARLGDVSIVNNVVAGIHAGDYQISVTQDDTAAVTNLGYSLLGGSGEQPRIRFGASQTARNIAEFQTLYAPKGVGLLTGTSTTIDTGVESDVYQTFSNLYGLDIRKDFNGVSRPQGSAWDIGAYESTDVTPPPEPPPEATTTPPEPPPPPPAPVVHHGGGGGGGGPAKLKATTTLPTDRAALIQQLQRQLLALLQQLLQLMLARH